MSSEDVDLLYTWMVLEGLQSGFPVDDEFSCWLLNYRLAEPVVDLHRQGGASLIAAPAPADVVALAMEDAPRWIINAGQRGTRWAGAVIDGGDRLIVNSDRASGYIPPGVHTPGNVSVLLGDDDSDFGRAWYACPEPAERLIAYAIHDGWIDRITTIITTERHPWRATQPLPPSAAAVRDAELAEESASAQRLAAAIGDRPIEVITARRPTLDEIVAGRGWPLTRPERGGAPRLAVIAPHRYTELLAAVRDRPGEAVLTAAELTCEAARIARPWPAQLWSRYHPALCTVGELLDAVAAMSPEAIADRRLTGMSIHPHTSPWDDFGLPGRDATALAEATTRAEDMARPHGGWRRIAPGTAGAWETVAIACEAIALWTADPLPVGDIEFAARMVTRAWT